MMLTTSNKAIDKQQLADLYHFYKDKNEEKYLTQILDYYAKLKQDMIHICFSGHFSAGKSTLINHLMKENLLPQSPIPTSANIVEIKQGIEQVLVHFNHQEAIKMKTLPPLEQLHQLCRDGDQVKKIEIYKNMEDLPAGVTLMDTPGIDAVNDADRLITESALHQVDVLFYVMDYNHVQSEVNATFLKEIDSMHKPYYVIINQMDKHDESEISFTAFQESLETVFRQWNIQPKRVFYTSMVDESNGINEFTAFQACVNKLVKEAHSSILQETLVEGINFTVQSSIQEEQKYFDEAIEELEEKIDDIELPNDSYEVVQNRYDLLIHERDSIEQEYMYIVEQTAKNAQLVPFEIREKAEVLLESYQPKFKVGLFRNVKKINDERHQRLLDFYATLKEKVESSLEWKLRDKVTEFLSSYLAVNLTDAVFEQNFKPEDFLSLMEDGATVNGEYLLVYTDQVAASVKKLYRQYYKNKWQEVQNNVLNPIEEKIKENKLYVARYQRFNEIQIEIKKYKNKFIDYKNELEAINNRESIGNEQAISLIDKKLEERKVDRMIDVSAIIVNNNIEKKEIVNKKEEASTTSLLSYKQTLMDANKAQQLIEPITSLDSIRQEIGQKKERLTDRHFTIALFGAFSAGKSSFANALIGEKILPVSPNPTTAAINKISPVRTGYRHKEVLVIFKQEQELLADINDITEKDFQFLNDAYSWIKKTKLAKLDIPDQHRSFLAALYQGYSEMKESIGLSYVVGFEDFQRYIRDETIACFVKEMELFYDCPLTKNHITLVDTPGADSVNARHTDLAFSYIKDADAILFVTYFNHPFSKPDQQFLERLGSVKDAFELDKMFFMINAIDLAKNEQEETMVVDYVRSELQRFDIKDPQIFPVSSKQAVEHKDEHTGLPQFEENFYRFVKEELAQMSMRSIYIDLARANSLVSSWLSMINSDQQEKERLIEKNKQNKLEIETKIEQRKNKIYFDMVAQKLTKQSFYAKQRFMIQFTDLWKDHIHPGAIQSSGKNGKKQLENALDKLFKTISVRSKHEYEAIVIRIEQSWNQAMQTMKTDMDRQLKEIDTVFSLSQYEDIQFMPPEIDLQEIHADQSLVSKWTQTYKDTKSFFADNVRKQLEEQVSDYLIARWQELISQMEQDLMKFYQSQWHDYEQKVWDNYLVEVDNYYRQVIDGIADQEKNKDQLENIHHYLEEVLADKKIG